MKTLFVIAFLLLFSAVVAYVLMRTGNAAPISALAVDGIAHDGPDVAPNELIIFSDYLCPPCKRYFKEVTLPRLRPLAQSGRVRIVFFSFPIRPGSTDVSKLATCAAHSLAPSATSYDLYEHIYATDYEKKSMEWIANDISLSGVSVSGAGKLLACAGEKATANEVDRQKYNAILHGIGATPTVVLNRKIVDNAWDIDALMAALK